MVGPWDARAAMQIVGDFDGGRQAVRGPSAPKPNRRMAPDQVCRTRAKHAPVDVDATTNAPLRCALVSRRDRARRRPRRSSRGKPSDVGAGQRTVSVIIELCRQRFHLRRVPRGLHRWRRCHVLSRRKGMPVGRRPLSMREAGRLCLPDQRFAVWPPKDRGRKRSGLRLHCAVVKECRVRA